MFKSMSLQSLEVFGVRKIPVSYFAIWKVFEYWKIFGIFERIKQAQPTAKVHPGY
jgi:hypothetical protein